MFPFGPTELILILAIVILIFGVGKLSQVGGALGKSIREFRQAQTDDPDPKQISTNAADRPTREG